jgi:hypothetical protein
MLAAHRLPKLGAHLFTALPRLHVNNLARKSSPETGARGRKGREKWKKRKKLSVAVWQGKINGFSTPTTRAVCAVQSALGVGGCGREICVLATCLLQFAKAGSTATQPQQEKNNSVDLQRGRVNITGFNWQWQVNLHDDVSSASSSRWPLRRGGAGA